MLAESVGLYKGVLDNGNFCTERWEFSTFKTGIPGGPGPCLVVLLSVSVQLILETSLESLVAELLNSAYSLISIISLINRLSK